jgi:hypothetical protein
MRVVPIQKQPGLFVVNSLLVERPQQRLSMPPLEDMYRNTNDLIGNVRELPPHPAQGTRTGVMGLGSGFCGKLSHSHCPRHLQFMQRTLLS